MYSITIFNNRFDNTTNKVIQLETWESFASFLKKLNNIEYNKKSDAPLISPAVYKEDSNRGNNNVIEWSGWFALDVDDISVGVGEIENVIFERFGGWDYVCHSTGSATNNKAKCRVILRTNENIPNDKIKHFWFGINSAINKLADRQTKDLSRMFYVPGKVNGSANFFFRNDVNSAVDVEEILKTYPYIEKTGNDFLDQLPEGIREQVINHKKEQLTNTSITWTSYKNCPFWPKKLAREYSSISETGWYNCMFRIMVAIACNALKEKYPISANQIGDLCKEFDNDMGKWYEKRPLSYEATSALNYAYSKSMGF